MDLILLSATIGDKLDSLFRTFDLWVFSLFGNIQNGFFTQVAKFFTSFGDENFIIPMVVLGIVLCFFKKTRKYGFSLVFAIIIGTLLTNVLFKPMVLRIRPYNTLQDVGEYMKWYIGAGKLSESDYSFPSGHTTGAFEIATTLAICFKKDNKKALSIILPIIAACTMMSRVYLMVHYPTDVLAGMLIGIFAGVMGYLLSCLVCKIKALDKIDAGKLFKKASPRLGTAVIIIAVIGIFCYSYIPAINEGGAQPCAYNEEYDCLNAARVDDEKYPAIDGKEYCKIHWKQLNGVS